MKRLPLLLACYLLWSQTAGGVRRARHGSAHVGARIARRRQGGGAALLSLSHTLSLCLSRSVTLSLSPSLSLSLFAPDCWLEAFMHTYIHTYIHTYGQENATCRT
jgi:hypothetical protein